MRPWPRLTGLALAFVGAITAVFLVVVPQWHLPVPGRQVSFDGPSMVQFTPTADQLSGAEVPPALPPAQPDPRPATQAFRNVQVLTDLDAGAFLHLQDAITAWVSPAQGCAFCHVAGDMASDARPQKRMARLMLRMTRHANAAWSSHVAPAGVTCFTCHRGQPVPSQVWFPTMPRVQPPFVAHQDDWQESATTVRDFFPRDGWDEYLLQDTPGVALSSTALPTGRVAAELVVKRLYEAMMQMSDGIGVNCTYCHNSRAFSDWKQSTPARWTGLSGIQMTRELNRAWLLQAPLLMPQIRELPGGPRSPLVPAREAGPQPGNALAVCATCHHGAPVPLGGANLLHGVPGLAGPDTTAEAAPMPPHG